MTDSPTTTTAPAGPQVYAAIAAVTHDMAQAGIGNASALPDGLAWADETCTAIVAIGGAA